MSCCAERSTRTVSTSRPPWNGIDNAYVEADRARYGSSKQKFSTEMATNAEIDIRNETYRVIDENLLVKPSPKPSAMILIGIGGGLVLE